MPRFMTRPQVVDAVQFDGSRERANELMAENADVFPDMGDAEFFTADWKGNLLLATPEGTFRVATGDWIVTDAVGRRKAVRGEKFAADYTPAPDAVIARGRSDVPA